MTWLMVVLVVLMGVLLVCLPQLSARSTPLGVSVPADRIADPAVVAAIRRFQVGVAVHGLGVAVLAVLISRAGKPAATACAPLALLVLAGVWYVRSRSSILHAKRAGDWFGGQPALLRASVPPRAPQHLGHSANGLFVVAGLVPFVALAYVGGIWDRVPALVPTHFDNAFQPDGWTAKGPALLLLVAGVPLGVVLVLLLAAVVSLNAPIRIRGAADAVGATAAARAQRKALGIGMGALAIAVSVGISLAMVTSARAEGPQAQRVSTYSSLTLILLGAAGVIVAVVRVGRRSTALDSNVIDDDRYWKGGLLYLNPDDPALVVEKRTGIGMTINFGHPAGKVLGIVLLATLVSGAVLAVVSAIVR